MLYIKLRPMPFWCHVDGGWHPILQNKLTRHLIGLLFHRFFSLLHSEPSRDVPQSGGRKGRPTNRQQSSGYGGGPPRVGPGAPLPAIPSILFRLLFYLMIDVRFAFTSGWCRGPQTAFHRTHPVWTWSLCPWMTYKMRKHLYLCISCFFRGR